jgi:hypothetical protein
MKQFLYRLQQQIILYYELNELEQLTFAIGLDWDELDGSTKTDKTRKLITHLHHLGRLSDLILQLREERSHVTWSDPPTTSDNTQSPPESRSFALQVYGRL